METFCLCYIYIHNVLLFPYVVLIPRILGCVCNIKWEISILSEKFKMKKLCKRLFEGLELWCDILCCHPDAGIPYGVPAAPLLVQLPLTHLAKQWQMPRVLESLHPSGSSRWSSLLAASTWTHSGYCNHWRSKPVDWRPVSLPPSSLCLSSK